MRQTIIEVAPDAVLLDTMASRPERPRGLHVTDIIHWIDRTAGITKAAMRRKKDTFEGWEQAAAVGWIFEDAIAAGMNYQSVTGVARLTRGLFLKRDGIWMSPDGMDADTGEDWECKATWRGIARWMPSEIWHWQAQFMAYCLAMGTNVTNATVLYICGDWHPPQPKIIRARMEYTDEELRRNWRMLTNAKTAMQDAGLITESGEANRDG